jgi:hypothetical protein
MKKPAHIRANEIETKLKIAQNDYQKAKRTGAMSQFDYKKQIDDLSKKLKEVNKEVTNMLKRSEKKTAKARQTEMFSEYPVMEKRKVQVNSLDAEKIKK